MKNKALGEVVEFILSFLIDRTGNEVFEKLKEKRKIIKLLKEDRKNIKQIFYVVNDSEMYILIEEFIMYHVLKMKEFYAVMNLTEEQENRLWDMFREYVIKERGGEYVNPEYKERIIRCVNLHNEAINNMVMDEKSKIHIKWQQKQNESIENRLEQITNILNTETKLQEEDTELEFTTIQLESIMKSYRYDINQLRKHQMVCIYGAVIVLVLMTVFMPISLNNIENMYGMYVMAVLFLTVIFIIVLFGINNFRKLRMVEKDMDRARDVMWRIHYDLYENQINCKYKVFEKIEKV